MYKFTCNIMIVMIRCVPLRRSSLEHRVFLEGWPSG